MSIRLTPADAFSIADEAHRLHTSGDFAGAIEKFYEALAIAPGEAFLRRDLGVCLGMVGNYEAALQELKYAAAVDATDAQTQMLLGVAKSYTGDFQGCKESYDRAIEIAPNSPAALWNRSLWLLLHREYRQGWDEYQWGFVRGGRGRRTRRPDATRDIIQGMKPGQTLFIWSEQGLGDTLQFMRLIKVLRDTILPTGVKIVWEVQADLLPILCGYPYADVVTQNDLGGIPLRDFEHVALLSLPLILELYEEKDFWTGVYLPCAVDKMSKQIGVCWKGNPAHPNDKHRSVPLEIFKECISGLMPISLVPGDTGGFMEADLNTFEVTRQAVEECQLIVTVDTAIAHLAGAMGKTVWLLVPFVPDFRWSLGRDTTPWYPTMRLFRQERLGDWQSVITRVGEELKHVVMDA